MSDQYVRETMEWKLDRLKQTLIKLQSSIESIKACYQSNVKSTSRKTLNKHKLYDSSAQDLREGLAFFEKYLDNISHSIKCDLDKKIQDF
jgi:hypothetical protein